MAFAQLVYKSLKIQSLRNSLQVEKEECVKVVKKQISKVHRRRVIHYWLDFKEYVKNWRPWSKQKKKPCPGVKDDPCYQIIYEITHEGSYLNYAVKSIIGFLAGFFLTYLFFIILTLQISMPITKATALCSIIGCILTIGLAFSTKVRCILFLLMPVIFSKKGRKVLLGYILVLAVNGPAKNTLNNMGILSESLTCTEEQLRSIVNQIREAIAKPFQSLKETLKKLLESVKTVIHKLKGILTKIKRIIMSILRVIKKTIQFLINLLNFCNKKLGTPYERCAKVFENAVDDCTAKLGPYFRWLCNIPYIVKGVCFVAKLADAICFIKDWLNESIIGPVTRGTKGFMRHVKSLLYVKLKFHHHYEYNLEQTKSMKEIYMGIIKEIKARTVTVRSLFSIMASLATLFFLFIIFTVIEYRFKFLTSAGFDNRFITTDFIDIDMQRAKQKRETVLPLNSTEDKQYIKITSFALVKSEKQELLKNVSELTTSAIKFSTHMATDYALYWILDQICYYGKFQTKVKAPNMPTVIVRGKGLLADLLTSVVKAFQPINLELEIDTVPCLPIPIPPDFVILLFACLVLTILEPYGLRFRHYIMCYYHPLRGKERAIWLYNHILRQRTNFLTFARRQLRRKFLGDKTIEKVTLLEWFLAKFKYGDRMETKQKACILCGLIIRENDQIIFHKCITPGCGGLYCDPCFKDLKQQCTVCLSPLEYGDLSDISEEQDSSEDEARKKQIEAREEGDDEGELVDYDTESSFYSISYQYSKDLNEVNNNVISLTSFKDVEEQKNVDYASMEIFRDIEEETVKSQTNLQRTSTISGLEDLFTSERDISEQPGDYEDDLGNETNKGDSEMPTMTETENQSIHSSTTVSPETHTTRSQSSKVSSVDSIIKRFQKTQKRGAFLADNIQQTFKYRVKYSEESETNKKHHSSSSESSRITIFKPPKTRKTNKSTVPPKTHYVNEREARKRLENKARQYYKKASAMTSPRTSHKLKEKKRETKGIFKRLSKRKSSDEEKIGAHESVELLNLNYSDVQDSTTELNQYLSQPSSSND